MVIGADFEIGDGVRVCLDDGVLFGVLFVGEVIAMDFGVMCGIEVVCVSVESGEVVGRVFVCVEVMWRGFVC